MSTSTKTQFLQSAAPLPISINGTPLTAAPKQFSTGSVGYFVNGKVPVTLAGGQVITLQISGSFTVIGSKDWRD